MKLTKYPTLVLAGHRISINEPDTDIDAGPDTGYPAKYLPDSGYLENEPNRYPEGPNTGY